MPTFDLLEIHTFGHVTIHWRSQGETLPVSPREAAFLIYLAYHRLPLSRVHLCQIFWPEETTARAQGNLRKLLLDLRKNLGQHLIADRESIGLHEDLKYWLDVHEFQWQMQPLEQLPASPQGQQEINTSRLRRGVQLYNGEFLGDLKLPKSRTFCTWLEREQQNFHQQAVNALKLLSEERKSKKCYAEALRYAKRIVELDPLEEDAHEQIMLLLAQMGCVAEALEHYQQYVRFLKQEVDTEPETHLTTLYHNIRTGLAPTQETERKVTVSQPNDRRHLAKQLPKPLTPLLGRAETLQQLQRYLTEPSIRLVTLTGMGGIGKTHLALTVAEQLALHFDDVLFLPLYNLHQSARLSPTSEPAHQPDGNRQGAKVRQELAITTAAALQIPIAMSDSPLQQLGLYLQQRQLLLIFDGFEPLAAGAHFLVDLLQEAPLLKVLVTTRESLQLPGEAILRLEGLPLPQSPIIFESQLDGQAGHETVLTTVEEYARSEREAPSLQLFLHCLQRQNPLHLLQAESLQAIRQICHLVEGNPLAIELAAGLSFHYSWPEIVERLQQDIDILGTGQRGREPRHRTIRTVLSDAWPLLSPQEQQSLIGLCHFTDSFVRDEAITAAGCTPQRLMELVNKSWVRSKGAGRYELPRLVRLFVQSAQPVNQG